MTLQLKEVPDHIKVKVNGEDRELFMSYADLEFIFSLQGNDLEALTGLADTQARTVILAQMLTEDEYVASYEDAKQILLKNRMSPQDSVRVLSWVNDHVLNFILGLSQQGENQQKNLQNLLSQVLSKATSQA